MQIFCGMLRARGLPSPPLCCAVRARSTTPHVPPNASAIDVAGEGSARFTGSRVMRWLRAPSIDVNFATRQWAEHSGPFRHMKQWSMWGTAASLTLRRTLFPDVLGVTLVASAICWYNARAADVVLAALDTDGDGNVSAHELQVGIEQGVVRAHQVMGSDFFTTPDMLLLHHVEPFTLTAVALGLMLTARTNSCVARYTEARVLWGGMTNEARALASRVLALDRGRAAPAATAHLVKCIMTFPHTLKYHLTVDGFCPGEEFAFTEQTTAAEMERAKAAALRTELAAIWDGDSPEDARFLDRLLADSVANRPLHTLHELSDGIARGLAAPASEGGLGLDPIHVESCYRSVTRFHDVLGACERLYKTPMYTGATRFGGACLWLWCHMLPFALFPIMGPIGTVPTSATVALFLFGIEDVGTRIEQPFAALPLWQYCDGIDASVAQIAKQHARMP